MTRTPEITYKIMSAVKSKNTRPEMLLRRAVWARGLRYRVNVSSLLGKPDMVFSRAKLIVFCDGDFWHGHNWAIRGLSSFDEEISHYSQNWKSKIINNVERDHKVTIGLESEGWMVLRFWGSDIKSDVTRCVDVIERAYREKINTH